MIVIPAYAKEAADNYRKMLRENKRLGLSGVDMPPDVADSALALHQNALSVYWAERENQRCQESTKSKSA